MTGPELPVDPRPPSTGGEAIEFHITLHEPGPVAPPPGDGWRPVRLAGAYGGAVVLWARTRSAD